MKILIPLVVGSFFIITLMGCTRSKESASIRIVLPNFSSSQMSTKSTAPLETTGANASQWNGSINSRDQINCYWVLIGGEEPELRRNFCKNTEGQMAVRFGEHVGALVAKSQLDIPVPVGSRRKIFLLGMMAQPGACKDFKGVGPEHGKLSHPRILAQRTLDIQPGDQEVTMVVRSDVSGLPELDECEVQDHQPPTSPTGPNPPPPPPEDPNTFGDGSDGDVTFGDGNFNLSTMVNLDAHGATMPSTKIAMASSRVQSIDASGKLLALFRDIDGANDFQDGDEVFYLVTGSWKSGAPDTGCGASDLYRGRYGFARIAAVNGVADTIELDKPITEHPADVDGAAVSAMALDRTVPFCHIQVVRVPEFNNVTMGNSTAATIFYPDDFSYISDNGGGILVMKVAGTLDIQSNSGQYSFFKATGKGFAGGFSTEKSGASSAGVSVGLSTHAEGGVGASNPTDGAGGGGGNAAGGVGGIGTGGNGLGGQERSYCQGAGDCPPAKKLLFGGGGGGGATGTPAGGNGGGIVLLFAKNVTIISGGALYVKAKGDPGMSGSTGEGGAGGGAGGTVLMRVDTLSGGGSGAVLGLSATGGDGGNGDTGTFGGGGGGGGAPELQWCQHQPDTVNMANIGIDSYSSVALGGAGGNGTADNGQPGVDGHGPQPGGAGDYSIRNEQLCGL